MATIDKTGDTQVQGGTFANTWNVHARFKPAVNTVAGDKVRLALIPAGSKLLDADAWVEDAVATLTLSLGFDYADGSAGDDEAYFLSAADVAAGGRFRANQNKPPLVLAKDAYLIATLGVAVFGTANQLDVVAQYDFIGPPTS